ncbi:aminotransferase class V-fold PLP-dependent enzyme [Pseudoduganella lutea]|uniref:Aminotransferase class V-fold PLP-dependent enzyme n=1 Tax=Pseudoduganella lutea TaxID=321985 RepID=A0A4P6KXP9_9BURK|nr:aminotransferase class V-fold PLP-dependent enzyme [Pseudoduganella lutea]QBE63816.1 aminotransferase class V-fold PLP-dependent enzyme [Pseudoduganella lutea]
MPYPSPLPVAPDDEHYWDTVRHQYAPSPDFINLENGYFGMPAIPVREALRRHQEQVDRENSYFLRVRFPERLERVMAALAAFTGAGRDELLLTRNAMESLNILIQGYPFVAGDGVLLARHDYDSAIDTFGMVAAREALALVTVDVPLDPGSDEEIVALYEAAITARTRLLHVTHVVHRTGQVMPVAKIAAMARRRGIDVIVDGAHSLAHIDYMVPALGAQFAAFNLHKWVGAPLGTGLLYIARERIADIAPLFGDVGHAPGDIVKLGHFSAVPPAPILAIEDALHFHASIGTRNKEARLRYLAGYWMARVRGVLGVRLFTPTDPRRHGALASFGIGGMAARTVAERLMEEHRIFTVVRGIGDEECVRVTPHLYTSLADLDALVAAIRALAG